MPERSDGRVQGFLPMKTSVSNQMSRRETSEAGPPIPVSQQEDLLVLERGSMTPNQLPALAGQLPQEDGEMLRAREEVTVPVQAMIDRALADGTLRPDVAFGDISLLIIRLTRPLPRPFPRPLDDRLAHRHLDLLIDGLRATHDRSPAPLPGPAMTLVDLRAFSVENASATQEHLGS